jgi:hypothetical protein
MSENQSSNGQQGMEQYFFRASAEDFKKIPGGPIAYWVSDRLRRAFEENAPLSPVCRPTQGLATGDNGVFVRNWHEVSQKRIGFDLTSRVSAKESGLKWFPYNKGGDFRRWWGNQEFVVNWQDDGNEIRSFYDSNGKLRSRPQNLDSYFQSSVSWSKISSSLPAFRLFPAGFIYDVAGTSIFTKDPGLRLRLLGFCNSTVVQAILALLSPTLNFEVGHIASLPLKPSSGDIETIEALVALSRTDWNSAETSWSFETLEILRDGQRQSSFEFSYQALRVLWMERTAQVHRLEVQNNENFIEAFKMGGDVSPEVPLRLVSLTCNPHYRYGGDRTEDELEALLLADTVREFLSYAVGCMFGRYSLDTPGLVLADQGGTLEDYLRKVPEPSFMPDANNVIPILDGDWFTDDIAERFKAFLRLTFGSERFDENLRFIEEALGKKGKPQAVRDYFLKDFWPDHLKRYKKRPIYWLFSSPKGSFNALIYLHRYRPDTVSVVLNDYLREFRTKLAARKAHLDTLGINPNATQAEKTRALKDIEGIRKTLDELDAYERDTLYPLAMRQLDIGLDDGVKVNYLKFGGALKKIPGLEAAEE